MLEFIVSIYRLREMQKFCKNKFTVLVKPKKVHKWEENESFLEFIICNRNI